jgi:hypothetical protein
MPLCKKNNKKTYKGNEPSPKGLGYCAHNEDLGKIRIGLDGKKWIIKSSSNGIKRWIRHNEIIHKGYKKYFIIDCENTKSFLIYIKKDVYIYKKNKLIEHYVPEKIFIGKSPYTNMPKYSLQYGKKYDGNTILLLLNNNNYVFISDNNIFNFKTNNDKILKFYSFIVNNNSVLPIAFGQKYIYFFNYPNGYLDKSEFPKNNIEKIIDKGIELNPFLISFVTHKSKNNTITLEEFKNMKEMSLDDISLDKIKKLAKIYGFPTNGTKKELAYKIENVKGILFYKK